MQEKGSTYLTVPWGINKGKEQTDIFLQELSMNQINNKKGRTKNFRTKYRQTLLAYVTVLCKKISVCVLSLLPVCHGKSHVYYGIIQATGQFKCSYA